MGALTPGTSANLVRWTTPGVDIPTAVAVGDTHKGGVLPDVDGTGATTDANLRQLDAIRAMRGKAHPLGGLVDEPLEVFQLGDYVHENTLSASQRAAWYASWERYKVLDGNHDPNAVRDHIKATRGSLLWGYEFAGVWFQALTETFVDFTTNLPPSANRINAVGAKLAQLQPGQPIILLMHRSLTNNVGTGSPETGGYQAEWAADAKDALEALCNTYNVVGMLQGHNHYSYAITWRGVRIFSPGSVAQSPLTPPYSVTYPESFLVMRFGDGWYDVAEYCFGYNASRVWTPNTWGFSERVTYA